ncbi:FecR family protein [Pedobacter gandavensis]|uniref:FecR family protein n=1 Tax=Pedobacter gandavensis TaxID=2679963 RepID=UPI0029300059|nr:FecR domain-containing protein [Pedobacter gandavensis]
MESGKLKELLNRYLSNDCTEAEKAFVETWYNKHIPLNPVKLSEAEMEADVDAIQQVLDRVGGQSHRLILWTRISAAALVVLSLSAYLYFNFPGKQSPDYANKTAITPGGDKAMLTLSDGSKISLTDIKSGEIAIQSGLKISKSENGQISYSSVTKSKTEHGGQQAPEYNTIETPRGGKFQILLPDGSLVWLDAASSLKYPVVFAGKERKVELTGQAYFEVAKSKGKSFKVLSANQEVEVLGTHFNVNAYANQPSIITTLLEGSVNVNLKNTKSGQRLKPGQQAALTGQLIRVEEVDVEQAIAWKNGYFAFERDDLRTVFNKLERWYDVEITTEGTFDHFTIGGNISRTKSLAEVLRVLQLTRKIKFKTEGRRIIAMP